MEEEYVVDLKDILNTLKKSWKIIVIFSLVGALIASVLSFFVIKPKYETQTKLFIGKEQGSNSDYNNSDIQMYQNLIKTYEEVVKTKDLVEDALNRCDVSITAKEVLSNLTVESITSTQIMQIKYKGDDPKDSLDILDAIKSSFVVKSQQLVTNGNVQVIEEPILPENPVSPNKVKNILMGIVLGLAIGVGVILLKELMDNTYKNKEQLEREFGIPVIGMIPLLDSEE